MTLEIYEKLWNDAISAFETGQPKLDPYLPDKANDLRRGVTLVFRPAANVRDAVADFVDRLAGILPGQYFYRREELYVTVLSIFSGTEHWRKELGRFEQCRPIIGKILKTQQPFKIKFQGVTASPESILIQGFPSCDGLAGIRSALRDGFSREGFADMLDRRYKVVAAHITIMRFCSPCQDMKPLLTFLKENRQTDLGECEIGKLELILGDWYASADKVTTLEEYQLSKARF
jgi:2'-5' RNA ligase